MITKVVVSAAGQGTRMLHLSEAKSKHLIDINQRPFLSYLLDNILEAGYKEIILVVGFRQDLIQEFLESYEWHGGEFDITMVNQFEVLGPKEKEYGTACPIKCVDDLIGEENFISLCGDNFYSVDDLKTMNVDDEFTYVAGLSHANPERYGVLFENGEYLEKIVEKPEVPVGNLINTSLYKFTPDIFRKVGEIKKSSRGEYEITDALSLLAKNKQVKIKKMKDFWMDFGRPEDVEKFAEFLKK